jgi:hypothetical protein
MYAALHHGMIELSRTASADVASAFWSERATADPLESDGEPDVASLRNDPQVLAALAELKRRPSLSLRPGSSVARVTRPVVRGNELALDDHLITPSFREGVRYLRGVDLVVLGDLATRLDQVPDMYESYNRTARHVPLPDFIGALSVMLGKGFLDFA